MVYRADLFLLLLRSFLFLFFRCLSVGGVSAAVEAIGLSVSLVLLLFIDVANIVGNTSLLKDIGVKKARFLFLLIVY